MTKLLLLASMVFTACTSSLAGPLPPQQVPEFRVASMMRGPEDFPRSPAKLDALLAGYDAMTAGPARDALAADVDRAAAQRYATVSRLYWHTDLTEAQAAAHATGKPILSLRMLGRLDEDLSCANSRLFRTTLYPDAAVAKLLRERFVLHWSSERAVPRVTIDLGDGRRIETTTTGNSAHYVLDADGRVLDVLPGIYAPGPFVAELTRSLALAGEVRTDPAAFARYHKAALEKIATQRGSLAGAVYLPNATALVTQAQLDGALAMAQRATVAKAYIEVPQLAWLGFDAGVLRDDDTAAWATVGQHLWSLGLTKPTPTPQRGELVIGGPAFMRDSSARPPAPATDRPRILDATTTALVSRIHDAGPVRSTADERARMIARLEQHLVADSAQNQLVLRAQIHAHLANGARDFEAVNRWVYATVFHTPASDRWLGLLPRTDFTGLPGDGAHDAITAQR